MDDMNLTKTSDALLIKEAADRFRANVSRVMGKEGHGHKSSALPRRSCWSKMYPVLEKLAVKAAVVVRMHFQKDSIAPRISCRPILGIYFFNQKNSSLDQARFANVVLSQSHAESLSIECMQEQ
jgi:hypothetical protein